MTSPRRGTCRNLAAVRRVAEKSNRVCFGPKAEDNYVQNIATGKRIEMIKKGASCVTGADFVAEQGSSHKSGGEGRERRRKVTMTRRSKAR